MEESPPGDEIIEKEPEDAFAWIYFLHCTILQKTHVG